MADDIQAKAESDPRKELAGRWLKDMGLSETIAYRGTLKPFVIIDAEILSSTVWQEPAYVKLVWITLLILCDTEGYVGASIPGIASAAGVELEQARDAMARFQQPDPDSRTQAHEGRRIEIAERGFRVLNFREHLDRLSAERAKSRDRVRRHREKKRYSNGPVTAGNVTVTAGNREQGTGNREQERKQNTSADADACLVYQYWSEKAKVKQRSEKVKDKTLSRIKTLVKDGYSSEELKRAVDVAAWDKFYLEHGYLKNPEIVFRNGTRIDTQLLKWEREASRPVPL